MTADPIFPEDGNSDNVVPLGHQRGAPEIHYGWRTITPDQARRVLARSNTHNRRLSAHHTSRLARDMAAGRWLPNGDAVRFGVDGTLYDGQHRLAACVKSGMPFRTMVIWNLPPESQATMDDGRKRTMGDILGIEGVYRANSVAAIVKRVLLWEQGVYSWTGGTGVAPTKREMQEYLAEHSPELQRAAEMAEYCYGAKTVNAPVSVLGLAYYLFARLDSAAATEFFTRLRDGAGLDSDSPILLLRNTLQVEGSTRLASGDQTKTLAYIIKAWNAWRTGRTIRLLRRRGNESFPVPV